jgi:hypothetical protein
VAKSAKEETRGLVVKGAEKKALESLEDKDFSMFSLCGEREKVGRSVERVADWCDRAVQCQGPIGTPGFGGSPRARWREGACTSVVGLDIAIAMDIHPSTHAHC